MHFIVRVTVAVLSNKKFVTKNSRKNIACFNVKKNLIFTFKNIKAAKKRDIFGERTANRENQYAA